MLGNFDIEHCEPPMRLDAGPVGATRGGDAECARIRAIIINLRCSTYIEDNKLYHSTVDPFPVPVPNTPKLHFVHGI
jgi:hypothetical protein